MRRGHLPIRMYRAHTLNANCYVTPQRRDIGSGLLAAVSILHNAIDSFRSMCLPPLQKRRSNFMGDCGLDLFYPYRFSLVKSVMGEDEATTSLESTRKRSPPSQDDEIQYMGTKKARSSRFRSTQSTSSIKSRHFGYHHLVDFKLISKPVSARARMVLEDF